ncbi:hypothetical protein MKY89_30860 [Bacillus sp. FSL W7-1294]|uniref:hypothetical protein n=1 Tax=Bacillus TaxID=1386 RepID=UPI00077A20AC|nr:hypothetical protein [Bacillus cereus]KXY84884.1 hypothetical protein AT270_01115 [Bacillus cereus]
MQDPTGPLLTANNLYIQDDPSGTISISKNTPIPLPAGVLSGVGISHISGSPQISLASNSQYYISVRSSIQVNIPDTALGYIQYVRLNGHNTLFCEQNISDTTQQYQMITDRIIHTPSTPNPSIIYTSQSTNPTISMDSIIATIFQLS